MKRSLCIAVIAGFWGLGCSSPVSVVGKTPEPVAVAPAAPWRTNVLGTEGITVEMPGVADEEVTVKSLGKDDKLYYRRMAFRREDSDQKFEAGVMSVVMEKGQMSREELFDEARGSMTTMQRRRDVKFGDFDGVAMTGTTDDGKFVSMRAYMIGEHVYTFRVEGAANSSLERDADRFFDSFRLQMPFRLFISRNDYYSIAKPMPSKYRPLSHKLPDGTTMVIHLFMFSDEDGYSMSVVRTAQDTNEPDVVEEILDNTATGLGKKEGSVIERMISVQVDDALGRDIIYRNAEKLYSRAVIVLKNQRMYIATRTAPQRSKMEDADADVFFGSLTIGRVP